MNRQRTTDLTYGHVGRALYDREDRTWRFSRQPGRHDILRHLDCHDVLVSGERVFDGLSRKQDHAIKKLLKNYPEITPGAHLLRPLAQVSETVTRVTFHHDPAIGSRLALGEAQCVNLARPRAKSVPVVAAVAGDARDSVRLLAVQDRHLSLQNGALQNDVDLRVPHLAVDEGARWTGNHGPVQQVCFAWRDGRPGKWLAVRQLDSTTILRPLYGQVSPGLSLQRETRRQPCRMINPNPLLTLSIDETGGIAHSDVAFNPWYNRQVGILDQKGAWSVWNLERKKHGGPLYKAVPEINGFMDEPLATGAHQSSEDGWGRLCWAGNSDTLLLFSRKAMVVLDIKSCPVTRLQYPDLDLAATPYWILDVQRSPMNMNHVFVVTTSQVFWLDTVPAVAADVAQSSFAGCRILLSWRHSRHLDDKSLQLSVTDCQCSITLLLYSRLSGLTTGFRFAESDGNVTVPQSVSDPYRIEYPAELWHRDHKKNARDRNISSLLLVSTKYSTLVNTNPKRSNSIPRGNQLELYGLFVLANDLSLHRCVYERGLTAAEWRRWKAEKVEVVNRTDPGTSSSNRRVRHEQAEDDAFVVGDDYLSPCEAPRETSRDGRGDLSKATACVDRDIWTLQWEWLYKHAFLEMDYMPHGQRNERQNAKVPAESQKEQRVIKAARRCFLENRAADGPSLTLFQLCRDLPTATSIDQASSFATALIEMLVESLQSEEEGSKHVLKHVAWPPLLDGSTRVGTSNAENVRYSIAHIHSRLCEDWIDPLRTTAPTAYLETSGRIALNMACHLYLASLSIQPLPAEAAGVHRRPIRQATQFTPINKASSKAYEPPSLTLGTTGPSTSSQTLFHSQPSPSDFLQVHSQPLPAISSSTGAQAVDATSENAEDDPLARLHVYTSISKPRQTCPIPPAISTLLAHWTTGTDPTGYSWESTAAALGAAAAEQGEPGSQCHQRLPRTPATMGRRTATTTPFRATSARHPLRGPFAMASDVHSPAFFSSQQTVHGAGRLHGTGDDGPAATPRINISRAPVQRHNAFQRDERGHARGRIDTEARQHGAGDHDDDVPMTQTEPGVFGSRTVTHLSHSGHRHGHRDVGGGHHRLAFPRPIISWTPAGGKATPGKRKRAAGF